MIKIRNENSADVPTIYLLNCQSFGQSGEAKLVDALREQSALVNSLVAEDEQTGKVIGHLAISPVTIVDDNSIHHALGLAPMAVDPSYQRQGIGSRLVRHWFQHCPREQDQLLVVLGQPLFYSRFDFQPAYKFNLRCEYDVPKDVFMVAELQAGALVRTSGLVKYHPAFAAVS